MDAPLSQREFDTWREGDETFKHVIRGFINTQTALNLQIAGRLSTMEAKQSDYEGVLDRRTTWISALVAAIVAPVTAFISWVFTTR